MVGKYYKTRKCEKIFPYILVKDIIIIVYDDTKAHDIEVTWHVTCYDVIDSKTV